MTHSLAGECRDSGSRIWNDGPMLGMWLGALVSTGAVGGLAWDWWRHPDVVPDRYSRRLNSSAKSVTTAVTASAWKSSTMTRSSWRSPRRIADSSTGANLARASPSLSG